MDVYNDGSKTQTSHMKIHPGFAVLDCGAAKSVCGAKLVALMAQPCAREGKRVGDERDPEAVDESYHFRGIGNQIVSSFKKLRVLGSIDGKEVSFAPSVTPGDIFRWLEMIISFPEVDPSMFIQMSVVSKSYLVELMQSCL